MYAIRSYYGLQTSLAVWMATIRVTTVHQNRWAIRRGLEVGALLIYTRDALEPVVVVFEQHVENLLRLRIQMSLRNELVAPILTRDHETRVV